ncbi:MAG: NUDIX hydrolase [Pyrinomonadaceae bacterium]
MPETLSSEHIYKGRIFDVRIDTVRDGELEYKREIISHKGSAVIVPVFEDGTVALVRQYRHAAGRQMLELPAGTLDAGDESPETGARRELEEEIGVIAENIEKMAEFYVSPGFLDEKMFVYLATGLTETAQNLDDDEVVEIVRLPLTEAAQMARDGRIEDAKTIIGLIFAAQSVAKSE